MNIKQPSRFKTSFDLLLMGAGLLFFVAWQSYHSNGLRWEYDEGAYLSAAQLINRGYALYADIYATHPPLFFYSLALGLKFSGPPIVTGRLIIILYSALGLISTGLIARLLAGRWAGLLALGLLFLHPRFFLYSKVITGNVPALSVAVLSLWCILVYYRRGGRGWLIASGISMALALAVKLLTLYLAPLPVLLIVLQHISCSGSGLKAAWKKMVTDSLIWGTAVVGVFFFIVLPFDKSALLDQTVALILKGQEMTAADPNWLVISVDLLSPFYLGLTLLALLGLGCLWKQDFRLGLWLSAWLIFTALALLKHAPLWHHFLVVWAFPCAILAGLTLKRLALHLSGWIARKPSFSPAGALMLAAALCYIVLLPYQLALDQIQLVAPTPPAYQEASRFLERHISEARFVITDEQIIAVASNRLVPPNLTDTSVVRIATGELTAPQLIALTLAYKPQAIVFGNEGRFSGYLPEYLSWVKGRYRAYPLQNSGVLVFIEEEQE